MVIVRYPNLVEEAHPVWNNEGIIIALSKTRIPKFTCHITVLVGNQRKIAVREHWALLTNRWPADPENIIAQSLEPRIEFENREDA